MESKTNLIFGGGRNLELWMIIGLCTWFENVREKIERRLWCIYKDIHFLAKGLFSKTVLWGFFQLYVYFWEDCWEQFVISSYSIHIFDYLQQRGFFFFLVLFFSLVPSFECLPVWSVMISYNKIDIWKLERFSRLFYSAHFTGGMFGWSRDKRFV